MRTSRRGNVTMVVMMFGTLLGFSALSVDIGLIRVAGTEIQVTLDAAALSAVQVLDGSEAGIAKARATALDIASKHHVLGTPVVVDASGVEIGVYDRDSGSFTLWAAGTDPEPVNAVRVKHQPPSFESGLGAVAFGVVGYTVDARSMAFRPPGAGRARAADCFLPLAIPDCHLASAPLGGNPPPMKFTFNPTPTDSIAWGFPGTNPNTALIRQQLLDPCGGPNVEVGDLIEVNEGVHNSALQTIADLINGNVAGEDTSWDPAYGVLPLRDGVSANLPADSAVDAARYGHTVEGAVALVAGGADCSAVSFAAGMPTTGIGWAVIYDVQDQGGNKNLWIQIDVVGTHEIWGEVDRTDTASGLNVLANGHPILELW